MEKFIVNCPTSVIQEHFDGEEVEAFLKVVDEDGHPTEVRPTLHN